MHLFWEVRIILTEQMLHMSHNKHHDITGAQKTQAGAGCIYAVSGTAGVNLSVQWDILAIQEILLSL